MEACLLSVYFLLQIPEKPVRQVEGLACDENLSCILSLLQSFTSSWCAATSKRSEQASEGVAVFICFSCKLKCLKETTKK